MVHACVGIVATRHDCNVCLSPPFNLLFMLASDSWQLSPLLAAPEPPTRSGGQRPQEVDMSGRSRSVLVSVFAVMLLFAGVLSVPVAHAATFNVNTTADGNDFDT